MKKILIFLIIIGICALPALADEVEWVDAQEKTLRITESVSRAGYIIEASDFYDRAALITVYTANNSFLTRNITRAGDSLEINDELNVTVLDVQERKGNIGANRGVNVTVDEWVKIQTRIVGTPAPKVSVFSYQREKDNKTIVNRLFESGSEIWINFSIKNDGKAVLKNLTLKVNSTLPLYSGEKLDFELLRLNGGNQSDVITVRFIAPFVEENKPFTISAELKGNDIFGKAYKAVDSTNIEVVPWAGKTGEIELRKYVSEKVFLGDTAVVSLTIENNGSKKFSNVNLTETLPSGLEPSGTNLSWNFALEPFEKKSISYRIKPKKPGSYIFLPGSSQIEHNNKLAYNTKSNKLIVTGPYVVLTKSASTLDAVKGEDITITVEARNIGDATAIVHLSDAVPANYSLPEPEYHDIVDTMVLRPGNAAYLSYILNTGMTGNFSLPLARAKVTDQFLYEDDRYTQRITSNDLIIEVSEPSKSQLSKINLTEPTLQSANIKIVPQKTVNPEITGTPAIVATSSKSASGFQGSMLFVVLFIIIFIIRMQGYER